MFLQQMLAFKRFFIPARLPVSQLLPCWDLVARNLTWSQSKAYCASLSGALMTPGSNTIQSAINETTSHGM